MLHVVGYHNPETMGYISEDCDPYTLLTRKKSIPDEWVGGVMWIMTCEGDRVHKTYLLSCWYVIDAISAAEETDFRWLITGERGGTFRPKMPELQGRAWFPSFLRWMGNFGRGVSELTLPDVIADLTQIANKAGYRLPS